MMIMMSAPEGVSLMKCTCVIESHGMCIITMIIMMICPGGGFDDVMPWRGFDDDMPWRGFYNDMVPSCICPSGGRIFIHIYGLSIVVVVI